MVVLWLQKLTADQLMLKSLQAFGSLTKLALVQMYMSLKEVQVLLRCCTNLLSLPLIGMFDIRILRLPKLKELLLLMTPSLGKFKVDTPDLQRLEYCGEMLPTSTFQSIPCLEHVSLQFTDDIYPEYDADKLEDISTCLTHVKSLCLRYQIPKVSATFWIFSNAVLVHHSSNFFFSAAGQTKNSCHLFKPQSPDFEHRYKTFG